MKIQKQNLLRILSVLLVVALLALNSVTMLTPSAEESGMEVPVVTDPTKFDYVYYEPVSTPGYYLGNIAYYDKETELLNVKTDMRKADGTGAAHSNADKRKYAPTIMPYQGVDNSTGLKIGMEKAFSQYLLTYRLADSAMPGKGSYTISFDAKKLSGTVTKIYAGCYVSGPAANNATGSLYVDSVDGSTFLPAGGYTDSDIKTDEWTKLSYTCSKTGRTGRYIFINLIATEDTGATIMIDNIEIINNDTGKNVFTGESHMVYVNADTADKYGWVQESDFPGTFEKTLGHDAEDFHYYVPTDDTGIYLGDHDTTSSSLDPFAKKELPGNDMVIKLQNGVDKNGNPKYAKVRGDQLKSVAPSLSNPDEGVDGSFALKFGTMEKGFNEYRVHWRWSDSRRSIFKVGTAYTIEMKVKKVSGKVDSLNAQQYYNNPEDWISKDSYTDSDLKTDEWTTLTFTETAYNPSLDPSAEKYHTGVRYMYLNLVASEGAVILVDDIKVYAANDAEKKNMFLGDYLQVERNPDVSGMNYTGGDIVGTFDKAVVYPNQGAPKAVYIPTEDTGIYLGDHDTTDSNLTPFDKKELPGNDMTVKVKNGVDGDGNPVYKILNGDALKAVAPRLSKSGMGVNGSYALEFGTDTTGFARYMANWRWTDKDSSIFQKGTSYTVEMKVKKLSGKVDSINAGLWFESQESTDYISKNSYGDADIKTDEWTTLTFTDIPFNPAKTAGDADYYTGVRFMFLNLVSESGAVILVDDITVYATEDAEKTELFLGKYLQVENDPDVSGMTYTGSKLPGTFDDGLRYSVVEVEEKIATGVQCLPEKFYFRGTDPEKYPSQTNTAMKSVPVISELGEGFNDTYGIKVGDANTRTNSLRLMCSSRQTIAPDTDYTVNFKITLLSGKLTSLNVGVFENGEGSNFGAKIDGSLITSSWNEVTVTHTTNSNTKNWKFVEIVYEAAEGGAVIVIDDLSVWRTDDETKSPIQFLEMHAPVVTCDVLKTLMVGTPVDNTPETGVKFVPIKISDWDIEYDGNKLTTFVNSNFPAIYEYSDVDKRFDIRPRISQLGEGVKGSYALVLGDKNVANVRDYAIGFRWISTGALQPETNYTFKIKLRKEGVIDRFTVGVMEAKAIGARHNAAIWSDSEISTEWQEYTFNYTTDDTARTNWNYLMMNYESKSGGQLYIDDLKIYETAYLGDENLQKFSKGSFEYVDLGQVDPIVLTELPAGMTAEIGNIKGNDQTGNGNIIEVKNYVENGKDNAVLALGFGEKDCEFGFSASVPGTQPGKTYKVSFRVLVQGEVDWARVGVIDSFRRYRYYKTDYDFNQYQNGKWTTIEFIYRDTADYLTCVGYRGIAIAFKAPAGSGMLIDDISITDMNWENAPNAVDYSTFSSVDSDAIELVWSDIFTYKEEK